VYFVSRPSDNYSHVGSEFVTTIIMNVAFFWDRIPYSPYVNRRFGGKYDHLHVINQPIRKQALVLVAMPANRVTSSALALRPCLCKQPLLGDERKQQQRNGALHAVER
jgi:hypothetical protein